MYLRCGYIFLFVYYQLYTRVYWRLCEKPRPALKIRNFTLFFVSFIEGHFWDNLFITTDYSADPPGSEKLSSLIIQNWHWNQSIREWITIIVIWFTITDFFSKVLSYLWFTFKSLCQFKWRNSLYGININITI